MNQLTGKVKSELRGKAHSLRPVVTIGNKGLTTTVINEVELALEQHELIKIKLPGGSKEDKKRLLEEISQQTDCLNVQLIGRIGVVYRKSKDD